MLWELTISKTLSLINTGLPSTEELSSSSQPLNTKRRSSNWASIKMLRFCLISFITHLWSQSHKDSLIVFPLPTALFNKERPALKTSAQSSVYLMQLSRIPPPLSSSISCSVAASVFLESLRPSNFWRLTRLWDCSVISLSDNMSMFNTLRSLII